MTSAKESEEADSGWKVKVNTLKEQAADSHAARAIKQYTSNGGNVISGGIAYFSLTSIAAALVILATVTSFFVGQDEQAQETILDFIDEAIPGVVSANGEDGLVDESTLQPRGISGIVGVIAFLVLFFTATRYIGGLRQGVKVMLGGQVATGVTGKMRDFVALLAIAVLVILGVALQVVASEVGEGIADWFGNDIISAGVVRGTALSVTLLVDTVFVFIAMKFLGRAERPFSQLWPVLVTVAVLIGLLRLGSTFIISSAAGNTVLAPFAAVITILIFADFVARFMLLAAAWMGTDEMAEWGTAHPEKVEGVPDMAGGPSKEGTGKAAQS